MLFRKATMDDLQAVAEIYAQVHTAEETGRMTVGWARNVYPTCSTAEDALLRDDLFVAEDNGKIVGTAIINQIQPDCYNEGKWEYKVPKEQVMVLHTLCVNPALSGRGYGRQFVAFYEEYALSNKCHYLRMDTQIINLNARSLYRLMEYKEIGTVPCVFNGIENVQLILLEKKLQKTAPD